MGQIVPTLLLAAVLAFAFAAPALETVRVAHAQAESARATLHIEGMTCASCGVAVRTALRRLDGVREATVSFERQQAQVEYDPQRVRPEEMVKAISDLGYRARVEAGD